MNWKYTDCRTLIPSFVFRPDKLMQLAAWASGEQKKKKKNEFYNSSWIKDVKVALKMKGCLNKLNILSFQPFLASGFMSRDRGVKWTEFCTFHELGNRGCYKVAHIKISDRNTFKPLRFTWPWAYEITYFKGWPPWSWEGYLLSLLCNTATCTLPHPCPTKSLTKRITDAMMDINWATGANKWGHLMP